MLLAVVSSAAFAYLLVGLATGNAPAFAGASTRRAQVSDRQLWLVQAGVDLTPRQFWTGSIVVGLLASALVTLLTATPAVAIVPGVGVGLLPRAYFTRQRDRRMRGMQEAWPDGVRDILASISAGMSLNQAVAALATAGPEALRVAFARYPLLSRMIGVVPALEIVKEEVADPTSDRIIEVLILAHEKGGHILTEILRDLAEATVKDVRATEEVATEALEQKINARAVFVLPWLVLLILTLRPGFFRDFYQSPGGLFVVVVGAILSLFGLWWVSRLSRAEVERRVLGAAARPSRRVGEAGR